jgi:preprotein translocase subunit YajC
MAILVPLVLLGLMYLLLIRPQQQRVRRARELMSSLEVGDQIVTIGGVIGTIVELEDDRAKVRVADGVVLTFIRPAISRKVEAAPSGTPEVEA